MSLLYTRTARTLLCFLGWSLHERTFSQNRALHEAIAASRRQFSTSKHLMYNRWHSEEVNSVVYISITWFYDVSRWDSCRIAFFCSCMFFYIYWHLIWCGTHLSFTFDYVDGRLEFVWLEITAEHVDMTWIFVLWVTIYVLFLRREELATLRRIIRFMFRAIISNFKIRCVMWDITIIPVLVSILLTTRCCWTHAFDEVLLS